MRAILVRVLLVVALVASTLVVEAKGRSWVNTNGSTLLEFVNLYIGTGGAGFGVSEIPPGPQVPFGAMRLTPDTSYGIEPLRVAWNNNGGYYYHNTHIEAFSHTHTDGAGEPDWQNFGVTMTRGISDGITTNAGYKSTFQHDTELVEPGYYGVNLDTWNTYAELTVCGTHAGRHRYTCRNSAPGPNNNCDLVVDLCHTAFRQDDWFDFARACASASIISVEPAGDGSGDLELHAHMHNNGGMTRRGGGVDIYFYFRVRASSVDVVSGQATAVNVTVSYWEAGKMNVGVWPPANTSTTSQSMGVAFSTDGPAPGMEHVFDGIAGLSFVSADNAALNARATLQKSSGAWMTFDECRASAVQQWESVLQRVQVANFTELAQTRRDDLVVFYTNIYHAHLSPTTYTEANGQYMGFDRRVHTLADGERHVSDLSLWDTYRTHGPMMALMTPEMARDTTNSMVRMYNQSNDLNSTRFFPIWPLANIETQCMVGHHGVIIASDNIHKHVRGIDVDVTFDAIVETIKRQNSEWLDQLGYTSIEMAPRAAAKTLDYAVDAGAVYNLALFLNRTDVARSFYNASQAYRNLWSNDQQAFCGRHSNGTFACEFMWWPYPRQKNFVEGNGGEYRYYVPHNIFQLVDLYQSKDYYAQQLYQFFADSTLWPFNVTLPNPFFWAGNEPTFLTPVQFNSAGNEFASLTQAWFPYLLDQYFFNGPAGIPGNDDYGAMSSWAFFGYLGIYPVSSTQNFTVFVPRFDDVSIAVSKDGAAATPFDNVGPEGGVVLRLVAHGRPASGTAYLANVTVNGVALTTPFFTHDQLLAVAPGSSSARIDFYLTSEATVFGAPAPSEGGPQSWQPTWSSDEAVKRIDAMARIAENVFTSTTHHGRQQGHNRRRRS